MKIPLRKTVLILCFLALTSSARAILVETVAISPAKVVSISVTGFYTGGALAGINQLLVDGTAANAFCIDPFHFALMSSEGYQFSDLASAPKPPATMGVAKADQISRLWTMAYSPTMTAWQAAGFQIALWEIVAGPSFSVLGNDFGASVLLSDLAAFTGPGARLVALTGPGQDYVIEDFRTAVPDGGTTAGLLLLALGGLFLFRRSSRLVRVS